MKGKLSAVPAAFALAAIALAAMAASMSAHADQPLYSNSFRVGSYTIFYHTSSDDLAGPYVPPGVDFKAKDLETLYVGYVRSLSTHFQVELALGYPPLAKVEGRGPATVGSVPYNGQVISSARWLAPTALLEYEFFDETAKLRPYIGVGINYTQFYDRDTTAAGDAATGGPTKLSLRSSVGPAATAGLAYHVTGHWNVYASYSISQVRSRLEADTGGVVRTTHINFGPQALTISGGYSF